MINKIKSDPRLKKLALWLLMPSGQARPRLWVKLFVNPFVHRRGKGSLVRSRTRMDVLPFNMFSIGKGSTIEDFSTVNNGLGAVLIGDGTRVGMSNVLIGPVSLGNNIIIAQNVVMSGLNHGYENPDIPPRFQPCTTAQITIEDDCWIGANVVLTAGVTVGKHSVVAAGAVVTKDIPPFSVAVGNPARVIKQYNPLSKEWEKISK
jgi:acetyltransferase-like isoleucine patch superfamily enzyme